MPHETIRPGIWLVKVDGQPLAVRMAGPVVAFRLKVMETFRQAAKGSSGSYWR